MAEIRYDNPEPIFKEAHEQPLYVSLTHPLAHHEWLKVHSNHGYDKKQFGSTIVFSSKTSWPKKISIFMFFDLNILICSNRIFF